MDTNTKRLVGAAIGLIGLGLIGYFIYVKFIAAGDEPPIRVKKGSLDLVLCDKSSWESHNGDYRPSRGVGKGQLWVTFTSTSASADCTNVSRAANLIHLRYSDNLNEDRVLIQSTSRTRITPGNVLSQPTNDPHILRYEASANDADHYISRIELEGQGGRLVCEFASAAQLDHIDICSGATPTSCGQCIVEN